MKKLALIGAMAMMLLASCSSLKVVDSNSAINAGAAAVQALTISDAQIKELCSQYMVESDGQNTILPADNSYTQRLDRIMARFKNINDLNLNYKVYQSSTVNAFASGDGSVRVYSGLMDAMNDDEVFAVIGHELGHLINKDVRDAYRAAYLMVAARYGIGAFSQTAGAISQGFLGDLGQQLASNAYSRRQETQADETAFQFCIQNGSRRDRLPILHSEWRRPLRHVPRTERIDQSQRGRRVARTLDRVALHPPRHKKTCQPHQGDVRGCWLQDDHTWRQQRWQWQRCQTQWHLHETHYHQTQWQ